MRTKKRPTAAIIIAKPPITEIQPNLKPQKLVQEFQNPQKGSRNTGEAKENSNTSNYASS